ncbi:phage tail tape measure protein [Psychrobacillus psychrodurans]|uniref:phage tail tape measure protein n=1 Tax=Psychrobacillus psychrodurans TaxID=126157 RepID=UPI003D082262
MAEEVGSLRVGLSLDSATFEQSMKSVDRNLKALGQEMAIVRARGTEWGNSVEGLRTKQNTLSTILEAQDVKVRKLNESYQRAVEEQGANSQAAENLAIRLNRATAEMTRTETELEQLTDELNRQEAELEQASNNWNRLGESLRETGARLQAVGDKMTSVGKDLSMKLTAPIAALGLASVKMGMDFEAQMDRVGAIAGATAKEMNNLKDVALELGASTSKSASEVAKGMEELAAMGFTANEVIGAMPGVISAAEASGSDMAQTAEVMASTLNIFGKEANEAGKVADILAQTANVSAASLTDMQYALKYAGPPAAALGVSLEELSAGIGIMTNAGMKGEQAGTTLRGALLGLLDPSEENYKRMNKMGIAITDTEGNFVGLANLVDNLAESMEGQTETQKAATISALVGKEAVSGMLSLMKAGPDEIRSFTKSLEDSAGASETAAAIMRDNLKGALDELGGAFETAAIEIGATLTPVIRDMAASLQGLVQKFIDLSPTVQKIVLVIAGLVAAIGPLLFAFGFIASAVGSILTIFGTISGAIAVMTTGVAAATPAIGVLATVFTALTGPVGIAIAAITGVIAILVLAYNKIEWFRDGVKVVWETIKQSTTVAFDAIKKTISTVVDAVVKFVKSELDVFKKFWDENGKQISSIVKTYFDQISATIKMVMGIIKGVFEVVWPLISATVRYAWETIKLVVSTGINLVLGIIQTVLKVLQGDWKGAWDTILKTIKNIWSDVGKFLKGIDLKQTGKDIIQGLINGIGSMADAVWKKVKSITDGIKKAITDALDIHSPSRVMEGYGVNIGQGLANGIQQMNSLVKQSATDMANVVIPNKNSFDSPSSQNVQGQNFTIAPAPIYLDGQVIAEVIFDTINNMQYSNTSINAMVRGVNLG